MNIAWKLLVSVLLLASIGSVTGDRLSYPLDLGHSASNAQVNLGSDSGSIPSGNYASGEKVFVGSINSNKYHYPDCIWAKKISPENEIWFSSSQDARAHGYVPCKVCNPP